MLKFQIYRDTAGAWRWRLKARNGRTVADSGEGYSDKRGAVRAASSLIGAPLVLVTGKDPAKVITKGAAQ